MLPQSKFLNKLVRLRRQEKEEDSEYETRVEVVTQEVDEASTSTISSLDKSKENMQKMQNAITDMSKKMKSIIIYRFLSNFRNLLFYQEHVLTKNSCLSLTVP